jgi:hypothetical protein
MREAPLCAHESAYDGRRRDETRRDEGRELTKKFRTRDINPLHHHHVGAYHHRLLLDPSPVPCVEIRRTVRRNCVEICDSRVEGGKETAVDS